MNKIIIRISSLLLTVIVFVQPLAADEWHFNDVDRVVAFSDVHGDYNAMVATLQGANVIDENLAWSGGTTHFVLVGDILDRGPDSRAAMDLLMRMEEEAIPAGGMVHVLIGNHEIMNLVADLRYVAPGEFAAFADDEDPAERDHWFEVFRSMRASPEQDVVELRAQFDRTFPAGYFAHRTAFAPDGKYGSWLLEKPMIVVVNGTAFVHGGLSPMVAEIGLEGVNNGLMGDVALYARQLQLLIEKELLLPTDQSNDHVDLVKKINPMLADGSGVARAIADIKRLDNPLSASDSPHWYRAHTYCSTLIESDRLEAAFRKIDAQRVVIGHSPTPTREIVQRLDGRVIEVDTGMNSSYYKGRGHALIIGNAGVSVLNQDGSEGMGPIVAPRKVGSRPGKSMTAEELEELLLRGEITVTGDDDDDLLQVSNGEQSVNAIFVKKRRFQKGFPNVAAYRLDRLLKLDMVPVAVLREYDGDEGALQFMPPQIMNEQERQKRNVGGGASCPLPPQWEAMLIFDTLMANDSRRADTILYNLTSWQLMLIGHQDAFTTTASKSTGLRDARIEIGPAWLAALKSLDDKLLRETFSDVLDDRRIKALGSRRDLLPKQNRATLNLKPGL